MSKQVYVSADYAEDDGDREIVDILNNWAEDQRYSVEFKEMSEKSAGSVSDSDDCRPCDLKKEFNSQINASSAVIFIVGDKTKDRTAGNTCTRVGNSQEDSECTPYKQNKNGKKQCKIAGETSEPTAEDDVGIINSYSYLRHEFEQAKKKKVEESIIIVYNSLRCESNWLPTYMSDFEEKATPFWIKNSKGEKVGNYEYIKEALGF